MIPVLDAGQAAEWDRRSIAAGIPSRVLMESAGRAGAAAVAATVPEALLRGVVVVAGRGNNGGDGWVMARALSAAGAAVSVVEVEGERAPDCEANRALALREGVTLLTGDQSWPDGALVVDALLGTGAAGVPRGGVGVLAQRVADWTGYTVAVDGPTGLDLSTGETHGPVRADLTLTFGGLRRGHLLARSACGRVVVLDIGFAADGVDPAWPLLVGDADAQTLLPALSAEMHKGKRGRIAIVGGQDGMAGAVQHAARGAFGAGAGLVRVVAGTGSVAALQERFPDVTTTASRLGPELEPEAAGILAWADAVVLGPGLGRGPERTAFVTAVLEQAQGPVVIDADALQVGGAALQAGNGTRVLTPHVGEFRAAFPDIDVEARFEAPTAAADSLANDGSATVLLKGVPTVIGTAGAAARVVATGNPGLATGGSGDVLAGLIGALLARGRSGPDAASLGAFLLGRAAELAARDTSAVTLRPAEVVAALPVVWRTLAEPAPVRPPILLTLDPPQLT